LNENLWKKAKGVSKNLFFICLERKQGRYRESRQKEVTVERENERRKKLLLLLLLILFPKFLFCRLLECGKNSLVVNL
jgi:hypothetical protein